MAGRYLDLERWPRCSHFGFYIGYGSPFFSVTTDVGVTNAYVRSREPDGPSFFMATLYLALRAANRLEAFRLTVRDGRPWLHDVVHAGSTLLRDDQTFAFSHFRYMDSYREFEQAGREVIARIRSGPPGLFPENRDDEIYFSVLPWIRVTAVTHARPSNADVIPRIVFGKVFERAGQWRMPVSVEAHHALMDGLHIAQFLEAFEAELAAFSPSHERS